MILKIHFSRVFAVTAILIAATGCKSFNDIKMTSCTPVTLSPKGLRSAEVVLAIGVDNPLMAFNITDVQGMVRSGETTLATFSTDSIAVDAKSSKVYEIPVTATLDKSLTLMNAMGMLSSQDMSSVKMDISARISTKKGRGKTVTLNDISIIDYLDL